jgi:hypothetical protein
VLIRLCTTTMIRRRTISKREEEAGDTVEQELQMLGWLMIRSHRFGEENHPTTRQISEW